MAREQEKLRLGLEDNPDRLGQLRSGETVIGNLFDPEINIPDSDLLKEAGFSRADLMSDLLSRVDASNKGYGDFDIVGSYQFDKVVGTSDCVATTDTDKIVYGFRPSNKRWRKKPTRFVLAREGEPSNWATVILRRQENDPNTVSLVAAWIGEPVSPEPVGRYNTEFNRAFWRRNALALRDLSQIDITRAVYQGDRKNEMSIKQLQDLFEEKEREFAVEKTIDHMHASGFSERFVQVKMRAEHKIIKKLYTEALHQATKLAKKDIETFVASSLGISIDDLENELGWKQAVRSAGKIIIDERPRPYTRTDHFALIRLEEILASKEFASKLLAAEQSLKQAQERTHRQATNLLSELKRRRKDPVFVAAGSSWTNAPDSQGNIGKAGRGFSGGVAHFFEYRGSEEKEKRFDEIDEPMTVDGFVAFTNRLKAEVVNGERILESHLREEVAEPSENHIVVLQDNRDNKRFYILLPNKHLILAYQKSGQPVKLSTIMTRSSTEYVDRVVAASIEGKDRGRLNKLGPKVRCIMRYQPINSTHQELAA